MRIISKEHEGRRGIPGVASIDDDRTYVTEWRSFDSARRNFARSENKQQLSIQ